MSRKTDTSLARSTAVVVLLLASLLGFTSQATAHPSPGGQSSFLATDVATDSQFTPHARRETAPHQSGPRRDAGSGAVCWEVHTYFVAGREAAPAAWVHNKSHSEILGENLEAAGINRPSRSAAHHIVAWDDPRAAESRAILKRAGVDIDSADNGVFLPRGSAAARGTGKTPHSRVHTDRYYEEVRRELRIAEKAGKVRQKLGDIAQRLSNHTFPYKSKTKRRRK